VAVVSTTAAAAVLGDLGRQRGLLLQRDHQLPSQLVLVVLVQPPEAQREPLVVVLFLARLRRLEVVVVAHGLAQKTGQQVVAEEAAQRMAAQVGRELGGREITVAHKLTHQAIRPLVEVGRQPSVLLEGRV
jgi:hypothetical protein